MKTTAIGYFTTERPVKQAYPGTLIDDQKDTADMLIEACNGNTYTINAKGIELAGKGVKHHYDNGYYEVTTCALRKLQAQYNVMTNF
jgi:hypothetical protein